MWRTKVSLKVQILVYSCSFAIGLVVTIFLALYTHKKRLKNVKTFPNKEISQSISQCNIETTDAAESNFSIQTDKIKKESLNEIISVGNDDVQFCKPEKQEINPNLIVDEEIPRVKSAESKSDEFW